MVREYMDLKNLFKVNGSQIYLTDIQLESFRRFIKSQMCLFKNKKSKIPKEKSEKGISRTNKCKLELSQILIVLKIDILIFSLHSSKYYQYNSQIIILISSALIPMNNTNLVELMAQNKNYEAHRKKIAAIMNSSATRSVVGTFDNKRMQVMNTVYNNREKAARYSLKNKQSEVDKQNDIILKKIIEVSNRRSISFNNKPYGASHSTTNLKKSMQSINLENQKLAQKLVTTNSDLRQDKLYQSFRKHLERKQRILKYDIDEQTGIVIPKKVMSMYKLKAIQPMRQSHLSKFNAEQHDEN